MVTSPPIVALLGAMSVAPVLTTVGAAVGVAVPSSTNFGWITDFSFSDAAAYDTITYNYTNGNLRIDRDLYTDPDRNSH